METIYAASVDFVGEVWAAWLAQMAWEEVGLSEHASIDEVLDKLPTWLAPPLGIEDLPDAYSCVLLHEDDTRAALEAVWCPLTLQWLFSASRAMLFGFSAAVIHFNRILEINKLAGPDS